MLTLKEFKTLWTAQKHTQYDDKYLQLDALLFEPKQWLPSMSISKKKCTHTFTNMMTNKQITTNEDQQTTSFLKQKDNVINIQSKYMYLYLILDEWKFFPKLTEWVSVLTFNVVSWLFLFCSSSINISEKKSDIPAKIFKWDEKPSEV